MKKIIALLLSFSVCLSALGAASEVRLTQRTADNSSFVGRDLPVPAAGADGILFFNGSTALPGYVTLGTGLSIASGVLNASAGATQVNSNWNAVSGAAFIENKPIISTVGMTGQYGDLLDKPTLISGFVNDSSYVTASSLSTSLAGYTTTSALTTGLAGKDALGAAAAAQAASIQRTNHTGTQSASTITGLSTVATSGSYADLSGRPTLTTVATTGAYADLTGKPTIPTVTQFNYGTPGARTLSLSTAYQANDPSKAADITVSPQCTASITLVTGSTCTMQARVGTVGITCSTGVVVVQWTNGNTGTLTIGLALNQIVGAPGGIKLPIGAYFILCATSGTFTINAAVDQSAG